MSADLNPGIDLDVMIFSKWGVPQTHHGKVEDHDDWIIVQVDMLLVPTVLQNYLIAEVEAEEKTATSPTWDKNTLSGRFTNFVNLLDMAAISVPSAILQSPDLRNEASETGETLHCLSSLSSHPFLSNHYLFAQSDTIFLAGIHKPDVPGLSTVIF